MNNGIHLFEVDDTEPVASTPPPQIVLIRVQGRARTAGSHRWTGRAITHADDSTGAWMQEVRKAAHDAFSDKPLLSGPVKFTAQFFFARPAAHFGTGRNAGKLKPSAPPFPHKKRGTDLAKLIRAVEDALTKTVWFDDVLVVEYGEGTGKFWSLDGREYAVLRIEEL